MYANGRPEPAVAARRVETSWPGMGQGELRAGFSPPGWTMKPPLEALGSGCSCGESARMVGARPRSLRSSQRAAFWTGSFPEAGALVTGTVPGSVMRWRAGPGRRPGRPAGARVRRPSPTPRRHQADGGTPRGPGRYRDPAAALARGRGDRGRGTGEPGIRVNARAPTPPPAVGEQTWSSGSEVIAVKHHRPVVLGRCFGPATARAVGTDHQRRFRSGQGVWNRGG